MTTATDEKWDEALGRAWDRNRGKQWAGCLKASERKWRVRLASVDLDELFMDVRCMGYSPAWSPVDLLAASVADCELQRGLRDEVFGDFLDGDADRDTIEAFVEGACGW